MLLWARANDPPACPRDLGSSTRVHKVSACLPSAFPVSRDQRHIRSSAARSAPCQMHARNHRTSAAVATASARSISFPHAQTAVPCLSSVRSNSVNSSLRPIAVGGSCNCGVYNLKALRELLVARTRTSKLPIWITFISFHQNTNQVGIAPFHLGRLPGWLTAAAAVPPQERHRLGRGRTKVRGAVDVDEAGTGRAKAAAKQKKTPLVRLLPPRTRVPPRVPRPRAKALHRPSRVEPNPEPKSLPVEHGVATRRATRRAAMTSLTRAALRGPKGAARRERLVLKGKDRQPQRRTRIGKV